MLCVKHDRTLRLRQARSLIRTKVDKALKSEIKNNYNKIYQSLNLDYSDAALFVNGMFFDMDTMDVFTLFEHLREEQRVMEGLAKVGELTVRDDLVNAQQIMVDTIQRASFDLQAAVDSSC